MKTSKDKKPTPAKKAATKGKSLKVSIAERMSKPLTRKLPAKKASNNSTRSPIGSVLKIQLKDLRPHPLLKRVGLLPSLIERETKLGKAQGKSRNDHKERAEELAGEFLALIQSISQHGVREPIRVVREAGGWAIVDGRHRWEACKHFAFQSHESYENPVARANAQKLATEGIPAIEVTEADAPAIVMDAVNRRHLSKGAKAYLAVLIHPQVATEEKRGGDRSKAAAPAGLLTQAELAKRTGVSERLMRDACEVFRLLSREDLRKRFEDGIWIGEGLDRIIAGVRGFLEQGKTHEKEETAAQKKARLANQWLGTGLDYFNSLERYWEEYARLDSEQEKVLIERATEVFREAPESIRKAILEAIA